MMLLERLGFFGASAPDRPAVVAGATRLTYRQLEEQAGRLAGGLAQLGVSKGAMVAIYTRRTADAIAGLLGAMKCGAAYTVVEDDGQQVEHHNRLAQIRPDIVVCGRDQLAALRSLGLRAIDIQAAQEWAGAARLPARLPVVAADDAAYILFTSGSTGKPKGVAVSHANIAHYTSSLAALLGVEPALRYAHVSTLAADLGNTSLFLSLCTGGCLHLVDTQTRKDPGALSDYLVSNEIQFVKTTPSHWNAIFPRIAGEHARRLRLKYLLLGGEAFPVSLARRILESGTVQVLANHYGPTETTVGVIAYPIPDSRQLDPIRSESVPIGRPLGATTLRVRTQAGTFAERGARGELYIGGPSVAIGYAGDPAATESKFVSIPVGGEGRGRFYKTGDHVEIDASGLVHFLGRVDRQVKINGYRVELEHIESVLRSVEGVRNAAVFCMEVRGRNRIAAAVLGGESGVDPDFLKRRLEDLLPAYMVPKAFVGMTEFPRNDNGKTDLKILQEYVSRRLNEARASGVGAAREASASVLAKEVRRIFRLYLRDAAFGDDDSFFDLGGDSLDAIQLIGELQLNGHRITGQAFLKNPTVSGVVRAIGERAAAASGAGAKPLVRESRSFSAAQDFFFRQRLAQPDHYNQAVLLECGAKVEVETMRGAVAQLRASHPSLRTAYGEDGRGRLARLTPDEDDDIMGVSFIPGNADERTVEEEIERVAQRVHGSLSLAAGRLFRAHLFKLASAPDQLLLVAHHVAVDVVSWRILISELARGYAERRCGAPAVPAPGRPAFWDWVHHVDEHRDELRRKSSEWLSHIERQLPRFPRFTDASNTEGSARTLWLGFSAEETRLLLRDLVSALGAPIHVVLMAAFAHCLGRRRGMKELAIDVESHGRVTFDDTVDVSQAVGWHTSTFPVFVELGDGIRETIDAAARCMQAVPHLGAAYGLLEKGAAAQASPAPSAMLCFNYLGEIHFSHDERFDLVPSRYPIGRARGDRNNRLHELKLTARSTGGHLVADLSFPGTSDVAQMTEVMRELGNGLRGLLGREASAPQTFLEEGTCTGLLSYVPKQLMSAPSAQRRRDYRAVLLTGATGYIGAHVLRALLVQSQAHVYCIARAKDGVPAAARLREAFDWYSPEARLAAFQGRYTVVEGDVSCERFGLAAQAYEHLSAAIDAVYHFAADTRLFGPEEEFIKNNVRPVQTCLDFAARGCPKDLHHMSTLAVCGINPKNAAVDFSEDSLDIGQEFQNYYESTKYSAECLVRRFAATGGSAFIYRSGNVSGNSRTARFQRNFRDNRLVQLLAACAKIGKIPQDLGDPVVLSPIDEVASAIVAMSLDPGTPGGTFHVDSPHEIPMERIFAALRGSGIALEPSRHRSFFSLFSATRQHRDPDLVLGRFWASRRPRNVRYRRDRTLRLLERLGCSFSELDDNWLSDFAGFLIEGGAFRAAVPSRDPDAADGIPVHPLREHRRNGDSRLPT